MRIHLAGLQDGRKRSAGLPGGPLKPSQHLGRASGEATVWQGQDTIAEIGAVPDGSANIRQRGRRSKTSVYCAPQTPARKEDGGRLVAKRGFGNGPRPGHTGGRAMHVGCAVTPGGRWVVSASSGMKV
jgi:hypothetical protein